LLVNSDLDQETKDSFVSLTGNLNEVATWDQFYSEILEFAKVVAPTMMSPLLTKSEMKKRVDLKTWSKLVENPLAKTLKDNFSNDLVRGVVLTDGMIGTFAKSDDFIANKCFIYHVIGNSTGQWRVPKGGMGVLVD